MTWFFVLISLFFAFPAQATIYRFSLEVGASDSNDGSAATPKKTISHANTIIAAASAGDKILFRAGDEWNIPAEWNGATYLNVNKSGTVGNYITIGAYDAAHPDGLVRTDSFTRPIINGDTDGDNIAELPSITWSGGYYTGLISVNDDSYVRIENIHVKYSTGYGIEIDGLNTSNNDYNVVHNCKTENTQHSGVGCRQKSHYFTLEYCEITESSQVNSASGKRLWPEGDPYPDHWPACASAAQDSDYATFRYNYIHHAWGEGIGIFSQSDYGVAEYNLVVMVYSGGIYACNVNYPTVRYNICFGTTNSTYWRGPYLPPTTMGPSHQISAAVEAGNAQNAIGGAIYGNMVAYGGSGIRIGHQVAGYNMTGWLVYNNTIVDCASNFNIIEASGNTTEVTLRNNASIKYQSTFPDHTTMVGTPTIDADYNFWSSTPDVAAFIGAYDVVNASPLLTKTSNWHQITDAAPVNGSDFTPQITSPLIDRVAGIASYTTLPLSGSTWPSAVTTGNAALEIKPNTPTLTSPCNGAAVTTTPTFVASAYAATSATPVDFGAVQLNMSGLQTHAYWQVCSDSGCTAYVTTTPATNVDDAVNLTQLALTAALNPGVNYHWRVRYKDNAYSAYPASTCSFYCVPGQTPTGSGGAVLGPGLTGSFTFTAPAAGKGSATLTGPP